MKKLSILLILLAFTWGCSGSRNPVGVGDGNTDNPLGLSSIDNPGTITLEDIQAFPAPEELIDRLVKEGRISASDLDPEGGLCPVLIDCWWVDREEYQQDWLWENYCWDQTGTHIFVWLAKLPDPTEPCPIMPTDIWGWLAFTQCDQGKPRPVLHSNLMQIQWGSTDFYKGIWVFAAAITAAMPAGYHDAIFLLSWDGPGLLPVDDACGIDFWESQQGGWPPRILMVFNPEPPHPPGGWPPCRLDGEDGETRPWCVYFPGASAE